MIRYWYEDGLIKCLSELCTEDCPRFYDCQTMSRIGDEKNTVVDDEKEKE